MALALAGAACQTDLGTAGCSITWQATLAGSSLTLLKGARLDVIGSQYALMGQDRSDDANSIRWASLDDHGMVMGDEHAYGLSTDLKNPLFAMAGAQAPGDTVLIGTVGADGAKGQLSMVAIPANGSAPAGPAAVAYEFPNGVPSAVAMVSSRNGVHAALAWVDDVAEQVFYAAVDATGALVGSPTPVASAQGSFRHLQFTGGNDAATIAYYSTELNTGKVQGAGWVIAEANESGAIDSSVSLAFSGAPPEHPAVVTATGEGYAIAWQDDSGDALMIYRTAAQNAAPPVHAFASSSDFGGATLQPPLVALSAFGTDFGVVFQRDHDAELWRLDGMGGRRSGALIFPSAHGNMGDVSTVRAPGNGAVLAATYADYTAGDAASGPRGDRLFVTATCY